MKDRDPAVLLIHALECIDRIGEYAQGKRENFISDPKTRDAILRNLEIIGQCLKDHGIESLANSRPDIRWRQIANFRNILAHEYMALDLDLIWEIVATHLPALRAAIIEQLAKKTS